MVQQRKVLQRVQGAGNHPNNGARSTTLTIKHNVLSLLISTSPVGLKTAAVSNHVGESAVLEVRGAYNPGQKALESR